MTDKFIGKQIKANEPTWTVNFEMQISSFEIYSLNYSLFSVQFIIFHLQSMALVVDFVEMCAIALKSS